MGASVQSVLDAISRTEAGARILEAWDLLPPGIRATLVGTVVGFVGLSFTAGKLLPPLTEFVRALRGLPFKK